MNSENDLSHELRCLREEVRQLNGHRFVRVHDSLPRLVGFQFLRGLAFGLGTVGGATLLVSILGYFLSQIDFLPIVGEWARAIADQIRAGQ